MPAAPPIRTLLRKVRSTLRGAVARLGAEARLLFRGAAPIRSEDRRILEQIVIPHFAARDDVVRVLFVGSDWYTRHYEGLFADKDYWTLDHDPRKRRFGARQHVVGPLQELDRHFAPGSLDLIVCNGVFGWGLDRFEPAEQAFAACYDCLRGGGFFVFGWNDREENRPFPPDRISSLHRYKKYALPGLGERHQVADASRHTFDFYRKPESR